MKCVSGLVNKGLEDDQMGVVIVMPRGIPRRVVACRIATPTVWSLQGTKRITYCFRESVVMKNEEKT